MKKLLISLLVFPLIQVTSVSANSNDTQSIEVVNNSNKSLHLSAISDTQDFQIKYAVPAFTSSLVISQQNKLKNPQEMLHEAILNNSAKEIDEAVKAGADVNQPINGRFPIALAVLLQHFNSIKCLLVHGASI